MSNIKKAIAILAGISLYASAHAVPVFYSGTGNYYEYVSDSVLSTEAQAAAAANSYLGATGYLATILDAGENTFITNLISDSPAWTILWVHAYFRMRRIEFNIFITNLIVAMISRLILSLNN